MQSSCFSVPIAFAILALLLSGCGGEAPQEAATPDAVPEGPALPPSYKQAKYATVALQPDLQGLSAGEREALPVLVAALDTVDLVFWQQVFGNKAGLLNSIPDADARQFAAINYGPWDRLDDDRPFMQVQPKPATSRFYPVDLQPGELDAAGAASADGGASLRDPYTIVKRDESGGLRATPFHQRYAEPMQQVADLLNRAKKVIDAPAAARYLGLRAEALTSDSFAASDEAWLKIDGALGMTIGPTDPGEDHIYHNKRAYTGSLWVGLPEWDSRVTRYRAALPELAGVLLDRTPSAGSAEVAFQVADLIHVTGSWNAGPKRFVLELPADEASRKSAGIRRVLLHNVARAKFDSTLVPLAENLISADQRKLVTFDAFFVNDLFQEIVRAEEGAEAGQALQRLYGKAAWIVRVVRANVIAAHAVDRLADEGGSGSSLEEHYATLVASAFRALRFGTTSAQGPAALILLNQLKRGGAVVYVEGTSTYRIDFEAMRKSVHDLAESLAGVYEPEKVAELGALLGELSKPNPELKQDLHRLALARVPIDVSFAPPEL